MFERFLLLVYGALFLAGVAAAQDIKIVDSKGLTRAVKRNISAADVVVRLAPGSGSGQLRLINTDGLAGDLEAAVDAGQGAVFQGVAPGTWQVDGAQAIVSVEIKLQKGSR